MQYRPLGNTGLQVSALSFGSSSLGGAFRQVDEAEAFQTVRISLDLGINLVDTSPLYGQTRSETLLGKALKDIPRDRYFMATKVGRYDGNPKPSDFSAKRTIASIEESLARLGLDYVDILQAHDIQDTDLRIVIDETLPALRKLQKAGKTRFIGVTGFPLKAIRTVAEAAPLDVILSFCRCMLNDTSLMNLIPLLKSQGVGIINASPLGMRLLSNQGPPAWHPAPAPVKESCAKAAKLSSSQGTPLEKLALQYALEQPGISTTMVGSASPENMKRNIEWAGEPLDRELLKQVLEILRPIHNVTWTSGRPENN
jgi:L-galactose dehydrogenase